MKFRSITTIATITSILLWMCSASFLYVGSVASFGIVGILAAFAQVIAVNSAKREGALSERRMWLVDDILDQVGDGRKKG